MTAKKDLKRLVRARLSKTGESYTAALGQIRKHAPRALFGAGSTLRRVERPEFGFALRVPGDWREDRPDAFHSPDEVARYFGTGPDLQNCLVFRRPAEPDADALRITHTAETHLREEGYGNFRRSRAMVGGLPGARLDFDRPWNSPEGVWALRHCFVVAAGHVFIVSLGTTGPERDARLVDALAAGFELIGDPPGAAADSLGSHSGRHFRRTVVDRDTRRRFAAYSPRARQVVIAALEEALRRGRAAVDQQDLLCGMAIVESSAGLDILAGLGVSQARLRREAELAFPPDPEAAERGNEAGGDGEGAPLRLAGGAERALAAAEAEARVLGHGYVGVEHLLLGLVADETGPACELLTRLGASPDATRVAVHEFLAVR